jgi:hypothetical protein
VRLISIQKIAGGPVIYNPRMPETPPQGQRPKPHALSPKPQAPSPTPQAADAMPCDRCGADMFRMHAVWRCPRCGFKTDCCGW